MCLLCFSKLHEGKDILLPFIQPCDSVEEFIFVGGTLPDLLRVGLQEDWKRLVVQFDKQAARKQRREQEYRLKDDDNNLTSDIAIQVNSEWNHHSWTPLPEQNTQHVVDRRQVLPEWA